MRCSTSYTSILFLALLPFLMGEKENCECQPEHPQTKFCRADTVVKISVTKKFYHQGDNYIVTVEDIFRDHTENLKKGKQLMIRTVNKNCPLNLFAKKAYVVSGKYNNGNFIMTNCDLLMPWTSIDIEQMRLLIKSYPRGCNCNIADRKNSSTGAVLSRGGKMHCMWVDQPGKRKCIEKYSSCRFRHASSACSWVRNKGYDKCIEEYESRKLVVPNNVNGPSVEEKNICSCQTEHFQTKFCNADFVALAVLLLEVRGDEYDVHLMRIQEIFKDSTKQLKKSSRMQFFSENKLCPVNVKQHASYVISGKKVGKRYTISKCDLLKPWGTLNKDEQAGFRHNYSKGCTCSIVSNNNSPKNPIDDKMVGKSCLLESEPRQQKCEKEFSYCIDSPQGGCGWFPSGGYSECMRRLRLQQSIEEPLETPKPSITTPTITTLEAVVPNNMNRPSVEGERNCTCLPEHPQTNFCKSVFVVKIVKQRKFKTTKGKDLYLARIEEVFKDSESQLEINATPVRFLSELGLCSENPEKKETYLSSGAFVDGIAFMSTCELLEPSQMIMPSSTSIQKCVEQTTSNSLLDSP